jgi:hypothetical protein
VKSWDGRYPGLPSFLGMESMFSEAFKRLAEVIPDDVELV